MVMHTSNPSPWVAEEASLALSKINKTKHYTATSNKTKTCTSKKLNGRHCGMAAGWVTVD